MNEKYISSNNYNSEIMNTADALRVLSSSITGTGFSMAPGCITFKEQKPVTLIAEHIIDSSLFYNVNPQDLEEYIRTQLAQKIAKKIIEEDLIKIQVSDDPSTMTHKARATVKIIQE